MTDTTGSILITGANGGLGSALASQIASTPGLRGYHGIYTVRNGASAPALDAALSGSRGGTPTSAHSFEKVSLDVSRIDAVREVALDIKSRIESGKIPPIRALVLNAGVEEFTTQTWNEEGLDKTFATNYLGHWLLTMILLGSMDRERGRVIWISSWSHNPEHQQNVMNGAYNDEKYKRFITDDLEPIAKGTWSATADDSTGWAAGYRRYGASELCGVMMIHELQRRLDHDTRLNNISVLALDPGAMPSDIVRQSPSWFVRVLMFQVIMPVLGTVTTRLWPNGSFRTLHKSASDVLRAALDCGPPPLSEHPKGLFLNGSELGDYNSEAKEPAKCEIVWKGSVLYAKLEDGQTALESWK
ncbi:hypothetical protein Daus18300_007405 [Diaporthe australafricana]|uniref:3beta-hydroxysteroid 3-dehydrogenase n=1 Tax=Diaporthe australafricana TaxID=127596 RepID=A0ABR3WNE4_9PEZI